MYSGNPRSQVDDRGQFVIAGLTPGSYELSAGVFFVSAKVGYKATKEVVVTAGATTDVNITVDLSSTPIKQP
jgi:uracil-DNA glycosylase